MEEQVKEYLLQLSVIAESLDAKAAKTYKVDTLKRIIEESDRLKSECDTCVHTIQDADNLIKLLEKAVNAPADSMKTYLGKVLELQKHFHKQHGFIAEGHYMAIFMSIGLCFGVAIASAINQFAYMALGLPIGLAIGLSLDEDAKKKGKVI